MKLFEQFFFNIDNIVYISIYSIELFDLALYFIETSLHDLNKQHVHIFYSLRKLYFSMGYIQQAIVFIKCFLDSLLDPGVKYQLI